jgi:hypothetical protein
VKFVAVASARFQLVSNSDGPRALRYAFFFVSRESMSLLERKGNPLPLEANQQRSLIQFEKHIVREMLHVFSLIINTAVASPGKTTELSELLAAKENRQRAEQEWEHPATYCPRATDMVLMPLDEGADVNASDAMRGLHHCWWRLNSRGLISPTSWRGAPTHIVNQPCATPST